MANHISREEFMELKKGDIVVALSTLNFVFAGLRFLVEQNPWTPNGPLNVKPLGHNLKAGGALFFDEIEKKITATQGEWMKKWMNT